MRAPRIWLSPRRTDAMSSEEGLHYSWNSGTTTGRKWMIVRIDERTHNSHMKAIRCECVQDEYMWPGYYASHHAEEGRGYASRLRA